MKKLTQEQYIKKAIKVHNAFYTYDKVKFINTRTKVINTCPIHGDFEQTPNNHLHGKTCFKCDNKNNPSHKPKNKEQFIKDCINIHSNRYNYNKFIYTNNSTKGIIICSEHGSFEQSPEAHINKKQGCPVCANEYIKGKSLLKTQEQCIEDFKKVHGDRYNYDKFVYLGTHTKGLIICNKCKNEFWQETNSHLKSRGCPKCNSSKGELKIERWLKEHNIEHIRQCRFKDCKNIRPLPFDFYLPKYNTCIEGQRLIPVSMLIHR